ncbi:MAG TPA: ATP-binding cassette domain-containing protein [Candidatus Limnocylindrales bacterium]|jgi:ABC-2 type transport system ATP-binding protein
MTDLAIETHALRRTFKEVTAVESLDLAIPSDQAFGLLGPNGAGKTTTIKMLITLLPPTAGRAWVAGHEITGDPSGVRRNIGYVPQLVSSDGALTGLENLRLSARLYHLPRSERDERIAESLAFMGLTDARDRMVRTYSGGMIRRLELAQAMLHRPPVLFLDEPTVGLDPTARASVWEHVGKLRDRDGTTIMLTTHYMEEADVLCDQIAVMHRGVVAASGTPTELKASVGPHATLDDVFTHYTGSDIDAGGSYREVNRTRRTAGRLG